MSDPYTAYLVQREAEAWWHMLNSVYNFLYNALLDLQNHQRPRLIELSSKPKEKFEEFNPEDFPFFFGLLDEICETVNISVNNTNQAVVKKSVPKLEVAKTGEKFSAIFESCCKTTHEQEEKLMKEYEHKQEKIFEEIISKAKQDH